jgi:hypothetical protein
MATDTANLMGKIYDLFSGIYASTASNKAFLAFEALGIPISDGMFKLNPSDAAFCQPLAVERLSEIANKTPSIRGSSIVWGMNTIDGVITLLLEASMPVGADSMTSLGAAKLDAGKRFDSALGSMSGVPGDRFHPAYASPVDWYVPTTNANWTKHTVGKEQVQGTTPPPTPRLVPINRPTWHVLAPHLQMTLSQPVSREHALFAMAERARTSQERILPSSKSPAQGTSPSVQANWRWCRKCQGLAFAGSPSPGACPAGGLHDHQGSGDYTLIIGVPGAPGQHNWRWCRKCQGLAFAGSSSPGACPAGGLHDHQDSSDYTLVTNGPGASGQNNWRWCRKCQGLAFAGSPSPGACPAGGLHDHQGSWDYSLTQLLLRPPLPMAAWAARPRMAMPTLRTSMVVKATSDNSPNPARAVLSVQPLALAQATASLRASTTAQQVVTDSIDISFEHCMVLLNRPWFPDTLLMLRDWYLQGYARGDISVGTGTDDTGLMPVLTTAFVVIRNLKITSNWSEEDLAAMQGSASFGPFCLIGRNYDAASNTLTCPGMQIVGWFCSALPLLPPVSDPTLGASPRSTPETVGAQPSATGSSSTGGTPNVAPSGTPAFNGPSSASEPIPSGTTAGGASPNANRASTQPTAGAGPTATGSPSIDGTSNMAPPGDSSASTGSAPTTAARGSAKQNPPSI